MVNKATDLQFELEERILILAPIGRDSQLIERSLAKHGLYTHICGTLDDLLMELEHGAAAAVLAEEAFTNGAATHLCEAMRRQPPWSDFPLIVLTNPGEDAVISTWNSFETLDAVGNVTLLERPIQEVTLQSAAKVALRARRRQYEVRDYLVLRMASEAALRESETRYKALAEELDQRVQQKTSELVSANRELEGFTYSIAHDLRSPLRRLMFTCDLINEDYTGKLDPEGKDCLEQMAAEARKLSVLVEDLLQYARLGQMPIKKRQVDVTALAKQAIDQMDLPNPPQLSIEPGLVATADAALLELVLQNLIDNANKYGASDRDSQICICFDHETSAFCVEDNGIGFNMEFASKLFQPFERLHRDAEYPGTGIGLANVKRIIERHGGRVWAIGEEGKGAKFFFTL